MMGDIIIDDDEAWPSREADATFQRLALSYDRIEVFRLCSDGVWKATALNYMGRGYRVVETFYVREDDGSYTSNLIERKRR